MLFNDILLIKIFDAVPSALLIVDDHARILHLNLAASKMLGISTLRAFMEQSGDVLRCVNALAVPDGCGHSENCRDCIIRNSVRQALEGHPVRRQRTTMKTANAGSDIRELHLLVSASIFEHGSNSYVLLSLEDVSELVQLSGLLPICASCKKIRDDKGHWGQIEQYISSHSEAKFTHGICPDCASSLYPEYFKKDVTEQ